VIAGHPGVASFELCRGRAWDGGRGKEDTLKEVENIEEQGGIDWVREREGHLARSRRRKVGGNVSCKLLEPDSTLTLSYGRSAR
jgi:hypothetical protein